MSVEYLKMFVNESIADGAIDAGDPEADEHTRKLEKGLSQIDDLREEAIKLNALQNAGVDNWEGYEYAIELLQEDE